MRKHERFIANNLVQKILILSIFGIVISSLILRVLQIHQVFTEQEGVTYHWVSSELPASCWQSTPYGGFKIPDCRGIPPGSIMVATGSLLASTDNENKVRKSMVVSSISYHSLTLLSPKDWWLFLRSRAVHWRVSFTDDLRSFLEEPSASMLEALLFGGSRTLTPTTRRYFEITGILHIVAASGWHLSLVTRRVQFLKYFLSQKRAAVVSMCVALCYLLIALSPSLLRAWVFFSFIISGQHLFQRQTRGLLLLLWSSVSVLVAQPILIYSVGFQLSVLATAGILIWIELTSRLEGVLPEFTLGDTGFARGGWLQSVQKYLRDTLSISLAAQAGVTPLLLANFGVVSLLSIPTTLLVVWVLPFIFYLGLALIGISALIPSMLAVGSLAVLPLTSGVLHTVEQFGQLSSFQLEASLPVATTPVWAGCILVFLVFTLFSGGSRYTQLRV